MADPTPALLIARREAVFVKCGMACRLVRLCPVNLARRRGLDTPLSAMVFRCTRCGGKAKVRGAGYQGWPVQEAELLAQPPWERALPTSDERTF